MSLFSFLIFDLIIISVCWLFLFLSLFFSFLLVFISIRVSLLSPTSCSISFLGIILSISFNIFWSSFVFVSISFLLWLDDAFSFFKISSHLTRSILWYSLTPFSMLLGEWWVTEKEIGKWSLTMSLSEEMWSISKFLTIEAMTCCKRSYCFELAFI